MFKIITNYFFKNYMNFVCFNKIEKKISALFVSLCRNNNEIYSIFFSSNELFDYHKIFVSCKYVVQIYFFRTYFNIYLAYLNYFSMLNYLFFLDSWKKDSYDC